MVCDMSSDIFSKQFDANQFAMIYAGAQKNMGPAGTVLYIIDTEQLGKTGRKLPTYMDLQAHIDKDSPTTHIECQFIVPAIGLCCVGRSTQPTVKL